MKTFCKSLMLIAAAAIAFVSCQKEMENQEIENGLKMKTIKVSTDIATRTTLDSNHENIVWSTGDEISLFNDVNNNNAKLTYSAGGYLEVEVPETTKYIYTHYPYYNGNENGPTSVSVYIAANQTQVSPGQLAGKYFPMVAKGTVSEDNKAIVSFYPVAGALALNIYHTGLSGEETVQSVTVTPTENTSFVGSQIVDLTADEIVYTAPTGNNTSVKVTLTNGLQLSNTAPTDKQKFEGQVYVCLAKQSYKSVKFTIETDKGTYEITSSATNAFDLVKNDFIPVNINLNKASVPTTFTVGENTSEKVFEIASIFPSVKNGIKFEYAQGESTNAPSFDSPFKWYKNSTVKISAGDTPLKKVVFSSTATTVTATSGTYSEGTWTAADNATTSVTFTNTGSQITFKSIDVYTDNPGTETVVTSTPTLTIDESAEIPIGTTKNLTVSTNYNNATVAYTSSDSDVATVDSDGVVTAVAQGEATITASIAGVSTAFYEIESVSAECEVTVTSDANVKSYQLVTDVSDLTVGSKVIIVSSSSSYALGSTQNTNNRAAAEVTKQESTVKVSGDDVQELTIGNGSNAGTYSLSTGEGYLYAASSSSNYLKTETELDANGNGSWSISVSSSGDATIIATGTNSKNFIRFNPNNGNPIFTCYDTGSNTGEIVKIYKSSGTGGDPITPKEAKSLTISGATTTYLVNESFVFDGTVVLNYSDRSTATLSSSQYTIVHNANMSQAGEYTITVKYIADETITASYSITVVDPNASKTEYSLTIDASVFTATGGYANNNIEKTSTAVATNTNDSATCEIKWFSNQVMKSGNNMQWQSGKGSIYNTTDLGTIKSVTVNSSGGSFTTYYGTSSQPSSGTTVGGGFFQVKVGSATGYTSSIVIVFEK